MTRIGQGGAIERVKKGKLPIPTPQEIIKDKLKELVLKHGWDALKWGWDEITKPGVMEQLVEEQKKRLAAKSGGGGGGGALVALAVLALASGKKRGRRRRR